MEEESIELAQVESKNDQFSCFTWSFFHPVNGWEKQQ
jgi:hypothetical protein